MKVKLIKNLKSRVLLVGEINNNFEYGIQYSTENPNLRQIISIRKIGKNYPINNSKHKITYDLPKGKWQLLSTLKDLADSDCEGLVDSENNTSSCNCEYCGFDFIAYRDYKNQTNEDFKKHSSADCLSTAKESFLSALESENVLFENPHEEPKICCSNPDCGCFGIPYNYSSQEELDDFLEAEQNVFSPETLIFVEL